MKTSIFLYCFILIVLTIFSCGETNKNEKKKNNTTTEKIEPKKEIPTIEQLYKENPYDYDTILKNGYNLHFKYLIEKGNEYPEMMLTLNRQNKIIDTLNIMGYGAPHKNLGYIGADFNNYFAFVQSFGSGNPHEMQLIRKRDGKVILNGFYIDKNEKNGILLYNKGYDSLMFYDITKQKNNFIAELNKCNFIKCRVSELPDFLKIKKITNKQIYIEISQVNGDKILKKYYR